MTVITHPRRKSRLATLINSPGGVSVGVALERANANVEALRGEAMTAIDAGISALESTPPPTGPAETPSRLDQAYRAATSVIDAAGPFELFDLCQAAGGLCDLIGATDPEQKFDWRVVAVHAQSLRLLQLLPPDAREERTRILESLRDVVDRKLSQAG